MWKRPRIGWLPLDFKDTVYDEAILAGEAGNLGSVSAPGSAMGVLLRGVQPNLSAKQGRHTIVWEFRARLADYHLPQEVIEAYATRSITVASLSLLEPLPSTPGK
jgi:hypothetical protein